MAPGASLAWWPSWLLATSWRGPLRSLDARVSSNFLQAVLGVLVQPFSTVQLKQCPVFLFLAALQ